MYYYKTCALPSGNLRHLGIDIGIDIDLAYQSHEKEI